MDVNVLWLLPAPAADAAPSVFEVALQRRMDMGLKPAFDFSFAQVGGRQRLCECVPNPCAPPPR